MFQPASDSPSASQPNFVRDEPVFVNTESVSNVKEAAELRDMWINHLMHENVRVEKELAQRHPLQRTFNSIFSGH